MEAHKHTPDLQKLSVVIAMILLAYSTTAFITIPTQMLEIQLPGFLLVVDFNFITVVAIVGAVLAAAGSDWILSGHPFIDPRNRWHHWLVPAFTAIAIGITLGTLPLGPAWWMVFGLGAMLMAGVLASEYISTDPSDVRYSLAVLALNAVSFALFLIVVLSISGAGSRLYILLAAVIPTAYLVSARSLFLRLGGHWLNGWAAGITLIISQVSAALFYLPLRPLQFSLILLGLLYGLLSIAANIEEKSSNRKIWVEPVLMTISFIALGFLIG